MGFCLIEAWSLEDALYMTVITISTVGYTEIGELSSVGRAFTSVLILTSIVAMAYWTASITSVLVEGDLSGAYRKKRMERMAKKMNEHVIVCGSTVYAKSIIETLYRSNREMTVVCDQQDAQPLTIQYPQVPLIELSPTDELALAKAGLASAAHIVAATKSDVDNLLIAMTCKQFNPSLFVIAFSYDGKLAGRMKKVGVDEVICPHLLGGFRVAELIDRNREHVGEADTTPADLEHPLTAGGEIPQFQIPHQPGV